MRVVGHLFPDLKDGAAIRLQEQADLFQHLQDEGIRIAGIFRQQAGAMADEAFGPAFPSHELPRPHLRGGLAGDEQTGLASLPGSKGLADLEVGVEMGQVDLIAPSRRLQGAGFAGSIAVVKDLVTLFPRKISYPEALTAGGIGIEKVMRLQIGNVHQIREPIEEVGQHCNDSTSGGRQVRAGGLWKKSHIRYVLLGWISRPATAGARAGAADDVAARRDRGIQFFPELFQRQGA